MDNFEYWKDNKVQCPNCVIAQEQVAVMKDLLKRWAFRPESLAGTVELFAETQKLLSTGDSKFVAVRKSSAELALIALEDAYPKEEPATLEFRKVLRLKEGERL